MLRAITSALFSTLLLLASARAGQVDPTEIMRRSVAGDARNSEIARNYTFLERSITRQFDAAGKVKSIESKTHDVTLMEGSPYRRLVERDDHPLTAPEEKKEQQKLVKSIQERRDESPAQRARRMAEYEKSRARDRAMMHEVFDAFHFRLEGDDAIDGRPVHVIEAIPKIGFQPKDARAKLLSKLKARLWIDKEDYQWARAEAELIDNFSVGLFLFRMAKGARLQLEQTRVNGEVWLPREVRILAAARVGLVKKLNLEHEITFRNYRKFQSQSQIVSAHEAP